MTDAKSPPQRGRGDATNALTASSLGGSGVHLPSVEVCTATPRSAPRTGGRCKVTPPAWKGDAANTLTAPSMGGNGSHPPGVKGCIATPPLLPAWVTDAKSPPQRGRVMQTNALAAPNEGGNGGNHNRKVHDPTRAPELTQVRARLAGFAQSGCRTAVRTSTTSGRKDPFKVRMPSRCLVERAMSARTISSTQLGSSEMSPCGGFGPPLARVRRATTSAAFRVVPRWLSVTSGR